MSGRAPHGLALAMAAAALAMTTWGVGRPALWLDEAASRVASQRSWTGLWILLGSSEAPLVPYYALLKVTSSAVVAVAPGVAASPEVLLRWPSVVAAVLAVWALTLWLARHGGLRLAISTGVLILVVGPFSRYAQEARPYSLVLMAAVVATILWTRLARDPRRRWILLYALSLAGVMAAHVLAGSLVLAHLFAAVVSSSRDVRRQVVLRTALGAALGAVLVSPLILLAAVNGQGPSRPGRLPAFVPSALVDTLTVAGVLTLVLLAGSALAVSVVLNAPRRLRFLAWLAMSWAVLPLAVLFPLMVARPNLLMVRYLLFVLPGWAMLGGLGLIIVLDRIGRVVARVLPPGGRNREYAIRVTGYCVGVCVIGAVAVSQLDALRAMRTADGHGDDIRPALAASTSEPYAHLPIVLSPPKSSLQFAAYAPAEEHRMVGVHVQRDQPSIWSTLEPYPARKQQLRQYDKVILLLRVSRADDCLTDRRSTVAKNCLPRPLDKGYRVERTEAQGRGWIFAVLSRAAPLP